MKTYFTLNTENMKILPFYLITSGVDFEEAVMNRPEGFSEYLILTTTQGEGIFYYEDYSVLLREGMILFVPPWLPHHYKKVTEVWLTDWISFDGNGLGALCNSLIPNEIHIIQHGEGLSISEQLIDIYRLTGNDYQKNALRISTRIYAMLMEIIGRIKSDLKEEHQRVNYVDQVIAYMNAHYREDITIDVLARQIGISPQYMCRLFKEDLDLRPFEYLRQIRINKSKSLLLGTDLMKIEAIAKAVGFNDSSYYGAVFKAYEKMTPRAFMKQHQRS